MLALLSPCSCLKYILQNYRIYNELFIGLIKLEQNMAH